MDYEKLYHLIVEQISDYVSHFAGTLRKPILEFPPLKIAAPREPNRLVTLSAGLDTAFSYRLNPQLLVFALTSIFIGTTLSALVPGKKTGPPLVAMTILATFVWIVYSCFIYLICRTLKGSGSFLETISIGIQLFAVISVLSSFTALLWGILITSRRAPASLAETLYTSISPAATLSPLAQTVQVIPFYRLPPFGNYHLLLEYPFLLYFVIQSLLLIVYVPRAVKYIHRLKGTKMIVATLILLVSIAPFIQYNTLVYSALGTATSPAPTPSPNPSPRSIIGSWRAITNIGDEVSRERFRELEFIFEENGHVESTGRYEQGGRPNHQVKGLYSLQGNAISIEFDGCKHFESFRRYQLHLESGLLKWEPPHFHGSMETIYFEPFERELIISR